MDQHGDVEGNYTLVSAQTLKNGGVGLLPTGRFFFKLFTAFTAAELQFRFYLASQLNVNERAQPLPLLGLDPERPIAWPGGSPPRLAVHLCLLTFLFARPGIAPSVDSKERLAPGELGFVHQVDLNC